MKLTREFYIPTDSEIVQDGESSAIAYIYQGTRRRDGSTYLGAAMFSGKRAKPDSHYRYKTAEKRAEAVESHQAGVRRTEQRKRDAAAERKAASKQRKTLDFADSDWLAARVPLRLATVSA